MKIAELVSDPDRGAFRAELAMALKHAALDELASVLLWDQDHAEAYVATAQGLYVATYTRGSKLNGELTPWVEVAGARVITTNEPTPGYTLRLSSPAVELTEFFPGRPGYRALRELASEVIRHYGPARG